MIKSSGVCDSKRPGHIILMYGLDTENNITDEEINLMVIKAKMITLYLDYLKITQ